MGLFRRSEEDKLKIKQSKMRDDFLTACQRGTADEVKKFLDDGVDINTVGSTGATPLYFAVVNGHTETVKVLLDHKANVNARVPDVNRSFGSAMGTTPLLIAAQRNFSAIANLLISHGAQVQVHDSFGLTPLHYAAKRGNFELVRKLLGKGADTAVKDKWNHTPEYYARINGNEALAKILKDKSNDAPPRPPRYRL